MKIHNSKRSCSLVMMACGLAMTVFASQGALAEVPGPAYQMAVLTESYHGKFLLKGNYDKVINALEKRETSRFVPLTNLCVAYTLKSNFDAARPHCEQAVTVSKARHSHSIEQRNLMAVALSNRGVLRALAGDLVDAEADFTSAIELKTGIRLTASNLNRLTQKLES